MPIHSVTCATYRTETASTLDSARNSQLIIGLTLSIVTTATISATRSNSFSAYAHPCTLMASTTTRNTPPEWKNNRNIPRAVACAVLSASSTSKRRHAQSAETADQQHAEGDDAGWQTALI